MSHLPQTLADPHALHGMLVHLPIMLGLLGVVPVAVLCIGRFRSERLRWFVAAWFVVLAASSGAAAISGSAAATNLDRTDPPLSAEERAAVAVHHHRGSRAWIWPLIPGVLVLVSARPRWRAPAGIAAALAAVGVAVWFGVIAHAGGRLVYARGLGVPPRASADIGDSGVHPDGGSGGASR